MAERVAGPEIERLVQLLARLPGLGPRSARRAVLHLIRKREELLAPLGRRDARRAGAHRRLLGLRQYRHERSLHDLPRRAPRSRRFWSSSRRSPISGRWSAPGCSTRAITCSAACCRRSTASAPSDLTIASLVERVRDGETARSRARGQRHCRRPDDRALHRRCAGALGVKVTRLAHGVPVGGELDYLDEGTLAAALERRTAF